MTKLYPISKSPLFRKQSRKQVAELIGAPADYFKKDPVYEYREKDIPKSNGQTRHIYDPYPELKKYQKSFLKYLSRIEIPDWVKSGKKGSSYIQNAAVHMNNNYVRTMDIAAFYENAKEIYIYHMFRDVFLMSTDLSAALTKFVTYNSKIPTGAPCSQLIIYWSYKDMFDSIYNVCRDKGIEFTVYVDDLTLSSNRPIHKAVVSEVEQIINHYGFGIKHKKSHDYSGRHYRQITGVGAKNGKMLVLNAKQLEIVELYRECLSSGDKRKIERLRGKMISAREIEPEIFPEIYRYLLKQPRMKYRKHRKRRRDNPNRARSGCVEQRL